jgi:hypothetical protein
MEIQLIYIKRRKRRRRKVILGQKSPKTTPSPMNKGEKELERSEIFSLKKLLMVCANREESHMLWNLSMRCMIQVNLLIYLLTILYWMLCAKITILIRQLLY